MTQTKRERLAALIEQQKALVTDLKALRMERAEAKIDGREFDKGHAIYSGEMELEQLNEAIELARKYADDEKAIEAAKADLAKAINRKAEVVALQDTYLDQIEVIQRATAEMARALATIHHVTAVMSSTLWHFHTSDRRESNLNFPNLNRTNIEIRICNRMEQYLGKQLPMFQAYQVPASQALEWNASWRADEEKHMNSTFYLMHRDLNAQVEKLQTVIGA